MGANSGIQWTDHTFNPWVGCQKVSEGCDNCYAEVSTFARTKRKGGLELWGPGRARHRTAENYWKDPIRWNKKAYKEACLTGDFTIRPRVFCASLADVLEDRRDLDPWREDLWKLIEATPYLDWLLLTKRPQNYRTMVPAGWWVSGFPPNVWAGCTAENQKRLDERWPYLARVPARVHFLSMEPWRGPCTFQYSWKPEGCDTVTDYGAEALCSARQQGAGIDWIIWGGESGRFAGIADLSDARRIHSQAHLAGVKFFFKQGGATCVYTDEFGLAPLNLGDDKGGDLDDLRLALRGRDDSFLVRELPVSASAERAA